MVDARVVRLGDMSRGHGAFPARPNDQASPNVFANNLGIHRQGDHWATHCAGPICHDGHLLTGSPNVFVNNLPIARVGDPISCGDTAQTGSPNVFAGFGLPVASNQTWNSITTTWASETHTWDLV